MVMRLGHTGGDRWTGRGCRSPYRPGLAVDDVVDLGEQADVPIIVKSFWQAWMVALATVAVGMRVVEVDDDLAARQPAPPALLFR
jgi:hypothetical protein